MRTVKVSLSILTIDMDDNDQIEVMNRINRVIEVIKNEFNPDSVEVQAYRGDIVSPSSSDDDDDWDDGDIDKFLQGVSGDTCDCPRCQERRAKKNQSRLN